jgi:hypothetical protein
MRKRWEDDTNDNAEKDLAKTGNAAATVDGIREQLDWGCRASFALSIMVMRTVWGKGSVLPGYGN